jgi:hypothetical protein
MTKIKDTENIKAVEEVNELSEIELVISEWSDYDELASRINDRYRAKYVSRTDNEVLFEGKEFRVRLKKI